MFQRIFVPKQVEAQIHELPVDIRVHVEAYLDNLDHLMGTLSGERLVMRFTRGPDGFLGRVEGACIFFAVDTGLRKALIQKIDVEPRTQR